MGGAALAVGAAAGALTQDHRSGLDAHRAAAGASIAGGAGKEPGIFEALVHRGECCVVLAGLAQPLHLAGDDDALARAEGELVAWAGRLAEAAFDAQVDHLVGEPHLLEVLDMHVRVGVEQHTRVEQSLGIEQRLDAAHQQVRLGAPFALDEGRDGAAGTVFGLEAAAILYRDQFAQVLGKPVELFRDAWRRQFVAHLKVQIAGQRMAEDHGVFIAMVVEQFPQIDDEVGEFFDRRRDVLGQHGGAGTARRAGRSEEALPDVPQRVRLVLVGRKIDVRRARFAEDRHGLGGFAGERFGIGCGDVDQDHRRGVGEERHVGGDRRQVLDGRDCPPLDVLGGGDAGGGLDAAIGEPRDGAGAGMRIGERDQPGDLERMFWNRVVGDFRDEAERALGADDQVHQDVDRVMEIDQRIDRIADGVLDPVFRADQLDQFGVGGHLMVDVVQCGQQRRVALAERRDRLRIARIEHNAVGQHDAQPVQRVVGVVGDAAAHA